MLDSLFDSIASAVARGVRVLFLVCVCVRVIVSQTEPESWHSTNTRVQFVARSSFIRDVYPSVRCLLLYIENLSTKFS